MVTVMAELPIYAEKFPLARHTSFRVGGLADEYFCPKNLEQLVSFLQARVDTPVTYLGLGSNVLIADSGVRGAVVHLRAGFNDITEIEKLPKGIKREHSDSILLRAEAGATTAKLSRYCARKHLPTGAFLGGIPGTVGGAIRMNSGAYGSETWDFIRAIEIVDKNGVCKIVPAQEFEVGYRTVALPLGTFVAAGYFEFIIEHDSDAFSRCRELLRLRNSSQPIGTYNCGCVFRNPIGESAGNLIDRAGLKGFEVGDAEVSKKHANFIINRGGATAKDIFTLISTITKRVLDEFGLELKPEVRIIGIDDE